MAATIGFQKITIGLIYLLQASNLVVEAISIISKIIFSILLILIKMRESNNINNLILTYLVLFI